LTKFHWLTVAGWPRRITSPNVVKIGRSIAEMLQFFGFPRWPPPPSWIFEIAKFYSLFGWRGLKRINMPNVVKIGQSVAKISRYFDFSKWRPPPSWIIEFTKFYWLSVSGVPKSIIVPNFVKSVVPLQRYCDFWNFQIGRRRHRGFLKL